MNIPPLSRTELTKRFAVVGDPVAHSLSPLIHTGWLETLGLDAHYGRVHLQSEDAADDIRAMAHDFAGLNVTLPHKIAALKASAKVDGLARLVGAANTLVNEAGQWTAYNTDVAGFAAAVRAAVGEVGAGSRVILIGAGGAARELDGLEINVEQKFTSNNILTVGEKLQQRRGEEAKQGDRGEKKVKAGYVLIKNVKANIKLSAFGQAVTNSIQIPPIELTDIGSDNAQGILMSEFMRRLLGEISTAVINQVKASLPHKPF